MFGWGEGVWNVSRKCLEWKVWGKCLKGSERYVGGVRKVSGKCIERVLGLCGVAGCERVPLVLLDW